MYEDVVALWQSQTLTEEEIRDFDILFAYHSNAIGNPQITYQATKEIYETGSVKNYTGDLRTLIEIENQKYLMEFLSVKSANKEPLSVELVKDVHRKLMDRCYDDDIYREGERAGAFKKDACGVREELEDVCATVKQEEGGDVLRAVAYFHLNFEKIRPFADGNGRVGGVLMNYYLMIHNYPPVIIFLEDKDRYFQELYTFDATGKVEGFIDFLKDQAVKTWEACKKS